MRKWMLLPLLICSCLLFQGCSRTPPDAFLNLPLHTSLDLFRNKAARAFGDMVKTLVGADTKKDHAPDAAIDPKVADLAALFRDDSCRWEKIDDTTWAFHVDITDKVTKKVTSVIFVLQENKAEKTAVLTRYVENGNDNNGAIEGMMMGFFS